MFWTLALYALAQAGTPALAAPSGLPISAPLWRGLSSGDTPEQAASALRSIEGIKTVEVVRKPKKLPLVKISYTSGGVDIGAMRVTVGLTFEKDQLAEVTLVNAECQSAAVEADRLVATALKEKYGSSAREKVVDDKGVFVAYQFAFWSDTTRVRMAFTAANPGAMPQHIYGTGKVGGPLAALSNQMADDAAESARKACPADGGARLTTSLTYSSQSKFIEEQRDRSKAINAKANATKEKL